MSRQDYNRHYKYDRPVPTDNKPEEVKPVEEAPVLKGETGPKGPVGDPGGKINLVVANCSRLNVRKNANSTSDILFIVSEGTRLVGDLPQGEWTHVTEVTPSKRSGWVMTQFVAAI